MDKLRKALSKIPLLGKAFFPIKQLPTTPIKNVQNQKDKTVHHQTIAEQKLHNQTKQKIHQKVQEKITTPALSTSEKLKSKSKSKVKKISKKQAKAIKAKNKEKNKEQRKKEEERILAEKEDEQTPENEKRLKQQLFIIRTLMTNKFLNSKQIWRKYEYILKQNKKSGEFLDYWSSLTQFKKTIDQMKASKKISSNGFDPKTKDFRGWKLNEENALKKVSEDVLTEIRNEIRSKQTL